MTWFISKEHQEQFDRDCLKWRGRLLTGNQAHWCYAWDGLPVDETTPEWPCSCAPRALEPKREPEIVRLRAEVERLQADHLDVLKLSHEWMAKHDRLLAFIQARPEMLKELITEDTKP